MKHYKLIGEYEHMELEDALRESILRAFNLLNATGGAFRPSRLPGVISQIFEEVRPSDTNQEGTRKSP